MQCLVAIYQKDVMCSPSVSIKQINRQVALVTYKNADNKMLTSRNCKKYWKNKYTIKRTLFRFTYL